MSKLFDNIQPAVKKETKKVALVSLILTAIMIAAFLVLHFIIPESVPFDYTVILGGIGGCFIAVLNFFLMGLTVQKVAAQEDTDKAKSLMKASYTRRLLLQIVWIVVAIVAPCFQMVAGIAPLLFPGFGIKFVSIVLKK